MDILDKAKKILDKKTQEDKEKEFLEKIKNKVQKKFKDKKEERKKEEEGYLNDTFSTLDSFHKAFSSQMNEEVECIAKELEEAQKAESGEIDSSASEDEEVERSPKYISGLPISGFVSGFPASGIFFPNLQEPNPKTKRIDPTKDLLKKYRKLLTED